MLTINNIKYSYDSKFDVFYLSIADKSHSYGDTGDNGVVISRDMDTEIITGAIIYDFKKRTLENKLPTLPNEIPLSIVQDIAKQIFD